MSRGGQLLVALLVVGGGSGVACSVAGAPGVGVGPWGGGAGGLLSSGRRRLEPRELLAWSLERNITDGKGLMTENTVTEGKGLMTGNTVTEGKGLLTGNTVTEGKGLMTENTFTEGKVLMTENTVTDMVRG